MLSLEKKRAMPIPRSLNIVLSELEKALLDKIKRAHTSSIREVERSSMILTMSEGVGNKPAAAKTDFSIYQYRLWRARWLSFSAKFARIVSETEPKKLSYELEKCIRLCLSDLPRPGSPCTFNAEQYCRIIAISLEAPALSNRPISEWTPREIADESIKRGIVPSISKSQVRSFLKGKRPKTAPNGGLAEPEV